MAKDVLNRRSLSDDQERILNGVLDSTYNNEVNESFAVDTLYIVIIIMFIITIGTEIYNSVI